MRASHTNKFGTVESELITFDMNKTTVNQDLICRIRIEETFLVTGVRKGFCRFLDNTKLKQEVSDLFEDSRVTSLELCDEECRKVPDDPVNYQVGFTVKIAMDYEPMAAYFNERWNEADVKRPTSDFDVKKLQRRAAMYSEEKWVGRKGKGDWVVKRIS